MLREAYLQYQAIDNDESLDKDQKAEAQNAASFSSDQVSRRDHHALDLASVSDLAPVPEHSPSEVAVSREAQGAEGGKDLIVVASVATTPSITHSGLVYALGTIAYDFGDEARRDLFRQAMAPVHCDGLMLTPIPMILARWWSISITIPHATVELRGPTRHGGCPIKRSYGSEGALSAVATSQTRQRRQRGAVDQAPGRWQSHRSPWCWWLV